MIKCVLLDLDGTVYISGRLIEGAKEAIERIKTKSHLMFVTNNSSISSAQYLKKLNDLGLNAKIDEIYTSGRATIEYLKANQLKDDVFLMGTDSLKQEFSENGIGLVENNAKTVVIAFDTELNYQKLLTTCRLIQNGANYIATHPDLVCPSLNGNMPDAGSFIALIKAATNREPQAICGKPYAAMSQGVLSLGFKPHEIMMIGDRLYTDMKFALNSGFLSTLVLSGETTKQAFKNSEIIPNFVINSLKDFEL